jgi:hypothetical protein
MPAGPPCFLRHLRAPSCRPRRAKPYIQRYPPPCIPVLSADSQSAFPASRIKRIIQADEDVGKVAQATPIAVCALCSILCTLSAKLNLITAKAVELFIAELTQAAAGEARTAGSKKLAVHHM